MRQESALPRPVLAAALVVLAVLLPASAALAQSDHQFAVGAGGSLVNDTGTASNIRSFGTAGVHLFGEMKIEKWTVLQLRYSRFNLPGTQPDTPNLRAEAGTMSVGYSHREEWWSAGIYVGGGVYSLKPKSLEPGQVPVDGKETVFGWTGGLVSTFDVAKNWDLRLELGGHILRTAVEHKPIFITGGISYHFF